MSIESFFAILLVVILGWYISFSASRLDRLHHRVETSWATLDALLQQRAALAHEIVAESNLDPATAYLISASASAARFANLEERSAAESVLSESLKLVQSAARDELLELPTPLLVELSDLTTKVKLAINIHLEAVNATRNVRKKLFIRLFRLAGKAPLPVRYAFEDDVLEPTDFASIIKMESRGSDMQASRKWVRRLLIPVILIFLLLANNAISPLSSIIDKEEVGKNLFSGLEGSNNQILVVKIDDTKQARPQIGLEVADIVYVEQVEAGLTRVAAVFSSTLPDLIGPVRSARISDIELLAQFGRVGLAYSGAQSKMRPVLAAANIENLSAERNPPSIYTKDPDRSGPVDMILKPSLLLERANAKSGTQIDSPKVAPWSFGDAPKLGTATLTAKVKWPNARYELKWDEVSKKYLIYFSDEPNMAASGSQLTADTAVIQLVSITPSIYGDKFGGVTPFSKTTGSGKAFMLRDGFSYELTWQRDLETDVTTWLDADGKVANFKPGRIWIFLTDNAPILTP
jgi:hypothetical protein